MVSFHIYKGFYLFIFLVYVCAFMKSKKRKRRFITNRCIDFFSFFWFTLIAIDWLHFLSFQFGGAFARFSSFFPSQIYFPVYGHLLKVFFSFTAKLDDFSSVSELESNLVERLQEARGLSSFFGFLLFCPLYTINEARFLNIDTSLYYLNLFPMFTIDFFFFFVNFN